MPLLPVIPDFFIFLHHQSKFYLPEAKGYRVASSHFHSAFSKVWIWMMIGISDPLQAFNQSVPKPFYGSSLLKACVIIRNKTHSKNWSSFYFQLLHTVAEIH